MPRLTFSFFPYADPTIPEAVQEDPEDHRTGPPDCHGRCVFRAKRDATWNGDHRGE